MNIEITDPDGDKIFVDGASTEATVTIGDEDMSFSVRLDIGRAAELVAFLGSWIAARSPR